jgi:hypothetical protein
MSLELRMEMGMELIMLGLDHLGNLPNLIVRPDNLHLLLTVDRPLQHAPRLRLQVEHTFPYISELP